MVKIILTAAMLTIIFVLAIGAKAEARPLDANGHQVIGHRPADCPRAWCGCGLRKFLGIDDKRLNLAWNWAKFPRSGPLPGAAAVRRHHVMMLVEHRGGSKWLVRDFNGGRGLAWLHVRDVRGFIFVQPITRLASQ